MPDDGSGPPRKAERVEFVVEPRQPLRFIKSGEFDASVETSPQTAKALGETFKAYRAASRMLLEGKYAGSKQYAPPHLREPSSAFVLRCSDGILVRYDSPGDTPPKVTVGFVPQTLAELAPQISENVLHFPIDPATYVPPAGGVQLSLRKRDGQTGAEQEMLSLSLMIFGSTALRDGFTMPAPPQRPIPLASIPNEFEMYLEGTIEATPEPTPHRVPEGDVAFVTRSRFALPVGWRAIEVYPPLGDEYWKPEYAPIWAEFDILQAVAQRNLLEDGFRKLDCRVEARKTYAALLAEFEALLQGPEEPVHQFLKGNPNLLNPTFARYWSKLRFGDTVSDFVFREHPADYELVEIEAPIRELFRQDGQQRQELTHAIHQTEQWIEYIADNKTKVEEELGLAGISTSPRALVVIGRSASLTEKNRRKLVTLEERQGRLRILTYDDVLARARANLERLFGPMGFTGHNVEVYFYSTGDAAGRSSGSG